MREGLEGLLAEEIRQEGFELYHWQLRPAGKRRVLQIYLHGEEGVGLDDCARVSRRLGLAIDEAEAVEGSFVLEVSSPGLDRSLHTARHYELALEQRVRLLHRGEEEDRTLEGLLVAVEEGSIRLETKDGEERLDLEDIQKARVVPEIKIRKG